MQARTTPVEVAPEQHTDFIFQVEMTSWPMLVATIGAAAAGARRRRPMEAARSARPVVSLRVEARSDPFPPEGP